MGNGRRRWGRSGRRRSGEFLSSSSSLFAPHQLQELDHSIASLFRLLLFFFQIISLPQPSPPVHLLTLTLNAPALPSTPSSAFPPQPSTPVSPIGSKLITTVSWAPSCGREFHLIATGSRDGFVRIWKVTTGEGAGSDGQWAGEVVAEMNDHG